MGGDTDTRFYALVSKGFFPSRGSATAAGLGYGTGTAWYKRDATSSLDRALVDSIKTAIRLGYRHLDGAEVYKTEPELGAAIRESGVKRERLFVTTKVITNIQDIERAIDASLQRLGLDYVDLYLIHSPFFAKSDADLQSAWRAMEAVQASGKARSIGVSNFLQPQLEAVLATARVVPAVNQIEYHPYLQHGALLPFMKSKGIQACTYAPLTPVTRAKQVAEEGGRGGLTALDGVLNDLAGRYAVTPGEVLLRWNIQQGSVPITTSGKEARLKQYLAAVGFALTPAEVRRVTDEGGKRHYRAFWRDKFAPDDRS
ncbi:hypothetical protein KEM52_006315 [Ascosphaera acerosa]|nr:hypothetical protein KEM52_006315 [Ascosphaera acerosa]